MKLACADICERSQKRTRRLDFAESSADHGEVIVLDARYIRANSSDLHSCCLLTIGVRLIIMKYPGNRSSRSIRSPEARNLPKSLRTAVFAPLNYTKYAFCIIGSTVKQAVQSPPFSDSAESSGGDSENIPFAR